MAVPAWFWPASGQAARGVALVPFKIAGMGIPDWYTPRLFPFSGTSFQAPIVLATGTPGLSAMVSDTANGAWTVSYDGRLWHQPFIGSATLATTFSSGRIYVGCVFAGSNPYVLASEGTVWASGATQVGTFRAVPAVGFVSSGTTAFTLLPGSGTIGTMSLPGGTTGSIALPGAITVPTCLAVSGGAPSFLGIGGWASAPALSGATSFTLDPTDSTRLIGTQSGKAIQWTAEFAGSNHWTQTQALTGLASGLSYSAFVPNGTQILVTSPTASDVQVLNFAGNVLSLSQTITVTSAASVAVAVDSATALVCQSGQSKIQPLVNTAGTWATSGVAVSGLPGISNILISSVSGAVASYASGLAFLTFASGVWAVASTLSLSFAPAALAQDAFGFVYAAGSGVLSVVTGTTQVGSGAWVGAAPTSLIVEQGRVTLAIPSDGILRVFGEASPGAWTQQASAAIALGTPVAMGLAPPTVFVAGSGTTQLFTYSGSPFVPSQVVAGLAGLWNGSSWNTQNFQAGHIPSALTFDSSGRLWVATVQNDLYSLSSGAVILTSGVVASYQSQDVPLGVSALLQFNGNIYAATSLPGIMIEAA